MKVIPKFEIPKIAQQKDSIVIDLVDGAFAPTQYEKELWVWGVGATKYNRVAAKKRLSKRWLRLAKKVDLLNKLDGKDVYIATLDGRETIFVQFFRKFVDYLKKNPQE